MNLQRRKEILELIAEIASVHTEGMSTAIEIRALDAMRELLAHIGTLEQTAAERVIARGAVVKPHTFGELVNQVRDIANQHAGTEQLREQIAYALAPHFERDAGPTPDYTGEGSAWVPPVEAAAVVVPEMTEEDYFRLVQSITCPRGTESVGQLLTEFIREHSSAIPADRVLGEGMVAVDSLLYAALINLEKAVVREWGLCCTGDRLWNGQKAIADRRDALRANQGGAAT